MTGSSSPAPPSSRTSSAALTATARRALHSLRHSAGGQGQGAQIVLTVDILREAARCAAAESSTRKLAKEIGMSAAGLRYFLRGGQPYAYTHRRLLNWYFRSGRLRSDAYSKDAASAALCALLEPLPPDVRPSARLHILASLRRACEARSVDLPPSLAALATAEHRDEERCRGS